MDATPRLGRTAPPSALIGIVLPRPAVRFERIEVSFRAIGLTGIRSFVWPEN